MTANPYARELLVEITAPSGQRMTLPAYYADGGLFAVRARPDQVGTYRFGAVSETTLGVTKTGLVVTLVTPAEVQNTSRTRLPAILIDPKNPKQFVRSDGLPYIPVGANLAWSDDAGGDTIGFYQKAFPAYSRANLNWMRVWMAHWDGLRAWTGFPPPWAASPGPGTLSEDVARTWDGLLEAAEDNGVYVQLVLQHHGQYTTFNDSNWVENPWNAANPGGFLKSPEDFFTDRNARVMTLLKYRYIVARWGWSPAIVSYELFNEVHWVDAIRKGHVAEVARWHTDVANYIRLVDTYGHLITTSTENIGSPIYEKMDYYQPHLYAANMLAAARRIFTPPYATLARSLAFYGEEGDDHEPLTDEVKKSGVDIVPPIWASVMGEGSMAAQPWNGWQMLEQKRQDELGAVFRFLAINRVSQQADLLPFSAVVECKARVPQRIVAGEVWQREPGLGIDYPLDGIEPLEAANIPAVLVGSAASRADGFPDRVAYRLDVPRATTMKVEVDSLAPAGGGLLVNLDGQAVGGHQWAAATGAPDPAFIQVPVAAGKHILQISNPGPDWIGVSAIDTGLGQPALGLIGRRNSRFIEAWVWHRSNLYALNPTAPVSGTVVLENVPAGSWKISWWDTQKGVASDSRTVSHPGGTLRIETPPITRHAALVLTLSP